MRVLFVTVLFLLSLQSALADGFDRSPDTGANAVETDRVNAASDASFDKRLPPVLPGEIVQDSGSKMRVWSSAGPVPVAEAPEPWQDTPKNDSISVIVDSRDGEQRVDTSSDPAAVRGGSGRTLDQKGLSDSER